MEGVLNEAKWGKRVHVARPEILGSQLYLKKSLFLLFLQICVHRFLNNSLAINLSSNIQEVSPTKRLCTYQIFVIIFVRLYSRILNRPERTSSFPINMNLDPLLAYLWQLNMWLWMQDDLIDWLEGNKYWKRNNGRDHVFIVQDPNALYKVIEDQEWDSVGFRLRKVEGGSGIVA